MPKDIGETTDFSTLTNDIIKEQATHPEASGDLTLILTEISSACKWISNMVRRAELAGVVGATGELNVQSEKVQKLDILSNEIMCHLLESCGKVAFVISEEIDEPLFFEKSKNAKYCVCFDPLDGSSNISCGISIGTIFGIYKIKNHGNPTVEDLFTTGRNMVAAGFCHYGSSTKMVYANAYSKTVNCYTFDTLIGEFVKTHNNIKIGSDKIYSTNEGHYQKFNPAMKEFLDVVKGIKPPPGQDKCVSYSSRYAGSMAGDIMRTLLHGGVFVYPTPKLRVLYECLPMALIIECAGGKASTCSSNMLDFVPRNVHERSTIVLGTKEQVELVECLYKKHGVTGERK